MGETGIGFDTRWEGKLQEEDPWVIYISDCSTSSMAAL
jgi:hypothetical protein